MYGRTLRAPPRAGRLTSRLTRTAGAAAFILAAVVEPTSATEFNNAVRAAQQFIVESILATDVVLAGIVGASPVTPNVQPSRTSGYAPLYIHVDGSAAVTANPTKMLDANGGVTVNIVHRYRWGDPTAPQHTITNLSANLDDWSGSQGAHVFKTPGTYTVNVDQSDDGGATFVTVPFQVTVLDPSVLPSYAVSRTGNFTGAPAGIPANRLLTIPSGMPAWIDNARYFFCGVDDWTSTDIAIQSPRQNVEINSYNGTALFRAVYVGAQDYQLALPFIGDIRTCNIRAGSGYSNEWGKHILFQGCQSVRTVATSGSGGGAAFYHTLANMGSIQQSQFTNPECVCFSDCQLFGDPAISGAITNNDNSYVFFGVGQRLDFLNSRFGRQGFCTPIRLPGWTLSTMRHCKLDNPVAPGNQTIFKLVAGGTFAYNTNFLASGGQNPQTFNVANWVTSKNSVADCIVGGCDTAYSSSLWLITAGPQSGQTNPAEPLEFVRFDRLQLIHPAGSWTVGLNRDIVWGGKCMVQHAGTVISGPGAGGAIDIGLDAAPPGYTGPYFPNA